MPSRKWMVRTATSVAGLLTMLVTTGSWDQEESVMAITVVLAAFNSYMLPNDKEVESR